MNVTVEWGLREKVDGSEDECAWLCFGSDVEVCIPWEDAVKLAGLVIARNFDKENA